jgi:hypothetical protein
MPSASLLCRQCQKAGVFGWTEIWLLGVLVPSPSVKHICVVFSCLEYCSRVDVKSGASVQVCLVVSALGVLVLVI